MGESCECFDDLAVGLMARGEQLEWPERRDVRSY